MNACSFPQCYIPCKHCRKTKPEGVLAWDWLPLLQGESAQQRRDRQMKERNVPSNGIFGA